MGAVTVGNGMAGWRAVGCWVGRGVGWGGGPRRLSKG